MMNEWAVDVNPSIQNDIEGVALSAHLILYEAFNVI
jgi:hypothetical protein